MATIKSLAPETLAYILEIAGEHEPFQFDHRERKTALSTLAASSLRAQSWREPAQALMRLYLDITASGTATWILESPVCGMYRTAEVKLRGDALGDGETIAGVLEKLSEIESLTFQSSLWELDGVSWMALWSLRDPKNLNLDAPFSGPFPVAVRPSFRL